MDAIYIVKKPVVTEKSTFAMNEENRYTFEVDRRANKTQIRDAVQKLYGVEVVGVTTRTAKGRRRRLRYGYVEPTPVKTATVRLKDGDTIELF